MPVVWDAVPSSVMVEPAFGPQRSRPASLTADREKRKRSRVTPEQLVHLERFFAMDRSPTAACRKEISDMLGMQERQTQIWFQNRRAKAKLQDGKKARSTSAETPPDTPPKLATGYQLELQNLLHEDEPVTIIPCTDLSVGTWRRIATSAGKHDLVAYLCDTKRCLSWFIHSSGYGFKMEIPFSTIIHTEFTNSTPGSGLASFVLSQPPTFYLESSSPPQSFEPARYWKKCADWTEDQQATKVLRHNLLGSAVQLAHILRHLSAHISGSDVHLHSPNGHSQTQELSPLVLEAHPSPPAALVGTEYPYSQDGVGISQPDHPSLVHRRSFSTPVPDQQLSLCDESLQPPFTRPSSGVGSRLEVVTLLQYPAHLATEVAQSISYSDDVLSYHAVHSSVPVNCESSQSFPPYSSHPRSYSAASSRTLCYEDDNRILHNIQSPEATPFGTPSPPILTPPFYPASNIYTIIPHQSTTPVISGIPSSDTHSDTITDLVYPELA